MNVSNRISVAAFSVVLGFVSAGRPQALADDRCPLSNPAYKDIRAAVTKLQEKLTLPAGCEKIEEDIKGLGTGIKDAVDALYKADAERQKSQSVQQTPAEVKEAEENRVRLKAAVDGIHGLSSVLTKYTTDSKNECGRALSSNTDFLQAFVETVNGLTPFAMVYGGPQAAPLVLGATAVTAVGKSILSLYKNRGPDMSDPKQRQLFIENACAFYSFNENFEALQNRDEQAASAVVAVEQLEKDLAEMDKQGKPSFSSGYEKFGEIDLFLQASSAMIKALPEVGDRLPPARKDAFVCNFVRTQLQGGLGARSVEHYTYLLAQSPLTGATRFGDEQLLAILTEESDPSLFAVSDTSQIRACAERSRSWIDLFKLVMDRMETELARPGRRDKAVGPVRKWEDLKARKSAALKSEVDRLAWLRSLSDSGAAIENSEISQARDDSRDALFLAKSRRALFSLITVNHESPAELWLEAKNSAAKRKLQEYEELRQGVLSRWVEAYPVSGAGAVDYAGQVRLKGCADVKAAVLAWMTARAHVDAARAFCSTFRYTIIEGVHGETAAYCFGKTSRFSGSREEAINSQTDALVGQYSNEISRIGTWLKSAACPLPKRIEIPKS